MAKTKSKPKTKASKKAGKAKAAPEDREHLADEPQEEAEPEAPVCKVDADKARELLTNLGHKKADSLDEPKLLGRLRQLDLEDPDVDPGKHKKLYARIVSANQNAVDIVLTASDEKTTKESSKESKRDQGASSRVSGGKGAAAKPAKGEKPAKSAPKGKGKPVKGSRGGRIGIGSVTIEMLKKATKKNPVTVDQIADVLVKKFPDRERAPMRHTVQYHVSNHSRQTLDLRKTSDGAWYCVGELGKPAKKKGK